MARDDRAEGRLGRLLRGLAPGTALREGLDNILRARTGALIVVGDGPNVMALVDGGFKIDSEFIPASLYELAKMDGAIILSSDARRILYANAQLVPDSAIPSTETGIRHRTAERVARQTGELVIAISQRRNIISIYKGQTKYVLRDIAYILTKANQAIQTLERYKTVLDQALVNLSALEFEDLVTVQDVLTVLQRSEMVMRVVAEVERYIAELGSEGRSVSMQLDELVEDVAEDAALILRDYTDATSQVQADERVYQLHALEEREVLDQTAIARAIGLAVSPPSMDVAISPRGYRILRKIPRLPLPVIENLVQQFKNLQRIMDASIGELDGVEGIGEVRARAIKDGLRRVREQVLLDRHI